MPKKSHKPTRGYDSDGDYYFTVSDAKIKAVLNCIEKGMSRRWQVRKELNISQDAVDFAIGQLLDKRKIKLETNGIIEQYFPISAEVTRVVYGGI